MVSDLEFYVLSIISSSLRCDKITSLKLSQMNLSQILRSRVPPDRLQQMIINFLKEIKTAHTHKKIYNKRRFPTMNKDSLCYFIHRSLQTTN